MKTATVFLLFAAFVISFAQGPQSDRQQFVRIEGRVALTHVRVIDGTGAAALEDQLILISGGQLRALGPTSSTKVPEETQILHLNRNTVLLSLVAMQALL